MFSPFAFRLLLKTQPHRALSLAPLFRAKIVAGFLTCTTQLQAGRHRLTLTTDEYRLSCRLTDACQRTLLYIGVGSRLESPRSVDACRWRGQDRRQRSIIAAFAVLAVSSVERLTSRIKAPIYCAVET